MKLAELMTNQTIEIPLNVVDDETMISDLEPVQSEVQNVPEYPLYGSHLGRILVIGFGSVGQAIVPIILRHIECIPSNITVLELGEHVDMFMDRWAASGLNYESTRIVEANLNEILSSRLSEGDFLINCSLNIDGIAIVEWCLKNGVKYIDTSIERWEDEQDEQIPDMSKRTLYYAHQTIREMAKKYPNAATCVVTHGANPGLVTHFTKAALLDIATSLGMDVTPPTDREGWAKLMMDTGTKVIHIAERDTQVIDEPKVVGEFVNTWSCEGFWAEGRAPAELGWGTHEPKIPENAGEHKTGSKNAIYLKQPGVSTLMKSWVPLGGSFNGFLVQHSEAVTISDYFTVLDDKGKVIFRPTVHYAYQPCDAAIVSVHEFRGTELEMQDVKRIAKEEIVSGRDELGVLLMGGEYGAWWYGSQLDITEARDLIETENATSLQVVGSMLGAICWALRNPNAGYVEPEELPFDEILSVAKSYLGPIASVQSDWTPLEDRNKIFKQPLDKKNKWAFENFLVRY